MQLSECIVLESMAHVPRKSLGQFILLASALGEAAFRINCPFTEPQALPVSTDMSEGAAEL